MAGPPESHAVFPERVHAWLLRWRFHLFALLVAHVVLVHFFVLGLVTWDGFGHRIPPVVELVKHGGLGREKYSDWALVGFRPFVELTNAPFLWLFGMEGLFFAFALTLFPFCVLAVYLFTREVTADRRAALYSAATYVLLPIVNAQLEGGYVDWAVPGLLAFFIYSLLAAGRAAPRVTTYAKIAVGAFLFTMSRQQAPYLGVFFFVVVAALVFVKRDEGSRLGFALSQPKVLAFSAVAFLIGLCPAASLQLLNFVEHGTPIYPYQFNVLGMKIGEGYSLQGQPTLFGLDEYSAAGLFKASIGAWLIPTQWPRCFFDGRYFGGGLFFITALLSLPFSVPAMNRSVRVLLVSFIVASFGGTDYWCPRFAYTLLLALSLCNGIAVASLLERPSRTPVYVAFLSVFALHALRPEWDIFRIKAGDDYPRMNVSGSKWFMVGTWNVMLYPDMGASFVIAEAPGNSFILPLYGRRLTNSVLGSVPKGQIGKDCASLHSWDGTAPKVFVVDDENLTKDCARTCVAEQSGHCLAYSLTERR
jgi:hypothetical protein